MPLQDPPETHEPGGPSRPPRAQELLRRLRASEEGTTDVSIPTLLHAVLRAHATGAVIPAQELTAELAGPFAEQRRHALSGQPALRLSWTAAQELSALPADFPAGVHRLLARSVLKADLEGARDRLRRFRREHRPEAEVAASQLARHAPTLDGLVGSSLARRRRSSPLNFALFVIFAILAVSITGALVLSLARPKEPGPAEIRAYQQKLADRSASPVNPAEAREVLSHECSGPLNEGDHAFCDLCASVLTDVEASDCDLAQYGLELIQEGWNEDFLQHVADDQVEPFGSIAAAVWTGCSDTSLTRRF